MKKSQTFIVKIKYSENNTIQGSVQWVDSKKSVNFRSMYELMALLAEAGMTESIRSWDDDSGTMEIVSKPS